MKKIMATLIIACSLFSAQADNNDKKIILWGIKGVLLNPDLSKVTGGNLGSFVGLTPERVERKLFKALNDLYIPLRNYTHTYPMLIEGWLTGAITNAQARQRALQHIKKNYNIFKASILKTAANAAFTPREAAHVLTMIQPTFALAQTCKRNGHTIALCSSWNADSFIALKNEHPLLMSTFDDAYISGTSGILACQEAFYDEIIKEYGVKNVYLVDCLTENLSAARNRGITTISATNVTSIRSELSRLGLIA